MAMNDRIPRKKQGLLEKEIEDEIVVMSPEGNVLHSFEGSARFIWGMIDGRNSLDRIAIGMTEEFQVENAQAQSDLDTFIVELEKLSLVSVE
jgi:hypothetical protein